MDYRILGSTIIGAPYFGKLPHTISLAFGLKPLQSATSAAVAYAGHDPKASILPCIVREDV